MGKASKWFRGLLGLKKPDSPSPSQSKPPREKRRWSFVKSSREPDQIRPLSHDPNKHAIAVAAATAAVAEAAVAAAQAAAAVVRLTSSGRCAADVAPEGRWGGRSADVAPEGYVGEMFADVAPVVRRGERRLAAVRIQSAFRGYLARKALRALKGLVRLQALVRGHIERKNTLRRMQALLRAQARARAGRSQMSDSSHSSSKSSQSHYMDPSTPEKSERFIHTRSSKYDPLSTQKRNGLNGVYERNRSDRYSNDQTHEQCYDERNNNDKILEIDTGKQHHFSMKRRNLFQHQQALSSDPNSHSFTTSKDSYEVQSLNPRKYPQEEDGLYCTADNSPQFYSASSRGGGGGSSGRSPFTPSKSDGQGGYLSGYSDHPNYMSYTESSKAKARSLSAPKQRPYVDRSSSSKRNSIHGLFGESRSGSLKVSVSALQANFTSKAYPGSGRLDRLGMPVGFKC